MSSSKLDKIYNILIERKKNGYKYLGTSVYDITISDLKKLQDIADKYGIPIEWISNLINHESAGTWNPSITNSIGATGLIQIMPTTAIGLGTSTEKLRKMSFSEQLVYVDKYLYNAMKSRKLLGDNGKIIPTATQIDLFMLIFYPASVGNPYYSFPDSVVRANGVSNPMEYANKVLKNPIFEFGSAPFSVSDYFKNERENLGGFASVSARWWVLPIAVVIFGVVTITTIYYIKNRK